LAQHDCQKFPFIFNDYQVVSAAPRSIDAAWMQKGELHENGVYLFLVGASFPIALVNAARMAIDAQSIQHRGRN
jgi:hypothetical protein